MRFQEFDFTHWRFTQRNPKIQALMKKSKMSHSEYAEEYARAATKPSLATKESSKAFHIAFKNYEHLDEVFNFFGNYEE